MAIVFGKNPVLELLKERPKSIERIEIADNVMRSRLSSLMDKCKKNRVRFDFVAPERIERNCKGSNHQGIIAFTTDFEYKWLEDLDIPVYNRIVILDRIEDPHNFGAIIRSAVASGYEAVIIQDRNAVQVTETVIKTSAGTVYKIPVARVKNISRAIEFLQELGFVVGGTSGNAEMIYSDYEYPEKFAVVIGNEGKGMREKVTEKCDVLIKIPLLNDVESLNASVAASLIFFESTKKLS